MLTQPGPGGNAGRIEERKEKYVHVHTGRKHHHHQENSRRGRYSRGGMKQSGKTMRKERERERERERDYNKIR